MSDTDILSKLVEENPDNSIVAEMLMDELYGERGYGMTEARRHVATIQEQGRAKLQVTAALRLLSPESPYRHDLATAVHMRAHALTEGEAEIRVVAGTVVPYCRRADGELYGSTPVTMIVIAGAEWIMAEQSRMEPRQWPPRSRRPKKRK